MTFRCDGEFLVAGRPAEPGDRIESPVGKISFHPAQRVVSVHQHKAEQGAVFTTRVETVDWREESEMDRRIVD